MTTTFLYILIPLTLSNVLHMLVVKKDLFSKLNKAIWTAQFGENKTWRGMLFLPLSNALITVFLNLLIVQQDLGSAAFFGGTLGLTYMLFELPNSYIKRRAGIDSGQKNPRFPLLFTIMDKTDSALGVTLVSAYLLSWTLGQAALFFVIASLTHALLSLLLVLLKIKKSF